MKKKFLIAESYNLNFFTRNLQGISHDSLTLPWQFQ